MNEITLILLWLAQSKIYYLIHNSLNNNQMSRDKPEQGREWLLQWKILVSEKNNWGGYEKWKDLPCSWVGGIITVKMTTLRKVVYRFNTVPIQIMMLDRQSNPNQNKPG